MGINKILRKRIPREFKGNFMRYTALLLLIAMGMYIIVAMIASAETVIQQTDAHNEKNHVEDGQFSVFLPLTDEQEKTIREHDVTLEKMFSIDLKAEDNSKLRMMKNREGINLIELLDGRLAENEHEAVLERRYAEEHDLSVNDEITVSGIRFQITGIGTVPDYDAPFENFSDTAVSSENFGLLFVTDQQYETIKSETTQKAENYCYAYILDKNSENQELFTDKDLKELLQDFAFDYQNITDPFYLEMIEDALAERDEFKDGVQELYNGAEELRDGLSELQQAVNSEPLQSAVPQLADGITGAYNGSSALTDGISELKTNTDELLDELYSFDVDNLTGFVKREDNVRIAGAKGDVLMNKSAGLAIGVIIMILFTYVISVFVMHQIQKESSVIGALYALGAKKNDVIAHYIALPTVISLIGAVIGFSPFGINSQLADTYAYYSLPDFATVYPAYLIIYAVLMPPVVSAIVNALVIRKRLSNTALSLIRNEQNTTHSNLQLKGGNFIRNFQIRQMLREARTGITVLFCMMISLMIMMLGLDSYTLCKNIGVDNARDTKYQYMYLLKYPTKEIPENGEPCFINSLSVEKDGYTLDVSVIGIDDDNPYYDIQTADGKNRVVASKSVAERYKVGAGDKFILSDEASETDYAFTIENVQDYSAGLAVFMNIDDMRELFGEEEDYYNCLLSETELDIDEGRLYSVTSKSDVEQAATVFSDLLSGMVYMVITMAGIIFFVVMYLMMSVMIDRASFGISLVKIFGYSTRDVKKLYLNGNTLLIALGSLVCIPVSKFVIDSVFPLFIPNVASGINLVFPWYLYLIIFACVMAVYFITNTLLVSKLNRITPAEVLKNRE